MSSKKKILYVTTVGGTMSFFVDLIEKLMKEGHTVDLAANETIKALPEDYEKLGCNFYHISCSRSPISKHTFVAINEIKKIVESNHYDIVHCHTPVAGVCTRLACRKLRKQGLKVFYTAHGFHFYKGAPLKNWLVYYPIEKICSYFTDTLITINHEDYELARRRMKAKRIEYVPGVGIDVDKFRNTVVDRNKKREELGIPRDAFLLLSVGELNRNKNHEVVIRALAKLNNPDIHYMIAGTGPLHDYLLNLAKELGVESQVHLLGYRTDVAELYKTADVNVFPSIREGLGLAAVEGMAAGLPLICSDNRGTREYAQNGLNTIVCKSDCEYEFAISEFYSDKSLLNDIGKCGMQMAGNFSIEMCNSVMRSIYELQA